jgi:rare lipoprotein A
MGSVARVGDVVSKFRLGLFVAAAFILPVISSGMEAQAKASPVAHKAAIQKSKAATAKKAKLAKTAKAKKVAAAKKIAHAKKSLTPAQKKAGRLAAVRKEKARVARIIKAAGPPPPVKKQYDGVASYYSDGQRTASGGRFNPGAMTAAHRSLPFGTKVEVLDKRSKRKVVVTINDRGPFKKGRVIDLSRAAARALGMGHRGVSSVRVTVLPKGSTKVASAKPVKKSVREATALPSKN